MKRLLLLLVCFISLSLSAKQKVVKLSEFVYYEGEVERKIPNGQGVLVAFNMKGQRRVADIEKAIEQNPRGFKRDYISGVFSNDTVKNANVVFASGWKYQGVLVYQVKENGIIYELQEGGMLQSADGRDPTEFTSGTVKLAAKAGIAISLSDYNANFSKIYFNARNSLGKKYTHLFGFPVNFVTSFNFLFAATIGQNYDGSWNWEGIRDLETYYTTDIGKLQIYKRNDSYEYYYNLVLNNGVRIDTKSNIVKLNAENGKLSRTLSDSIWTLEYANGDKYEGSIRFVNKNNNQMYKMPSLDSKSPIYYESLKLDDNVVPYTGTFTTADGNSFNMVDGKTEEELMAQAEAEIAEQERAEEQRQAELKRQQAAREANAKKVAEQRKLLNECNGKTFSFNQYFTALGGKWQVTNGNASIKFWKNGQEIIVRISGTLNILEFREITADGELSCYEAGNPLYGSWYIKIINNKGKKAFVVNRPLGGLKYLLQ